MGGISPPQFPPPDRNGSFTQEDPIGIAGGLNLYGYANGDPVNFSDPFGLDACKRLRSEEEREKCRERMQEQQEQEDEGEEAFQEGLEQAGRCVKSLGGLVVRAGIDLGLTMSYSSGIGAVYRGSLLIAEGGGIKTGLILSTTLRGAGSSGAGELGAGAMLSVAGAGQIGQQAMQSRPGVSFVPGMNTYRFVSGGGFDGCSR